MKLFLDRDSLSLWESMCNRPDGRWHFEKLNASRMDAYRLETAGFITIDYLRKTAKLTEKGYDTFRFIEALGVLVNEWI